MTEPTPAPVSPPVPPSDPVPVAQVVPRRSRLGWYWLLPLTTVLIVAGILGLTWSRSGVTIILHFLEGHGLKPGDAIRCRGIIVGEVRDVRLNPNAEGVLVQAILRPDASDLARAGSRFWIVRPQADLATGVRGLDTVVGARYVMVQPGAGEPQTDFIGLESAPVPETVEAGGLELVLQADRLAGLQPGAPVTFRQVRIGSVLRVGLASDASAVDVHIYIRQAYARLVRQKSRFWNTSGVRLSATVLSGLAFEAESAEALLTGGIALATPDDPGEPVLSGARFRLEPRPDPKSEQWRPPLELAGNRLPQKAALPQPVLATLLYRTRGYLYGTVTYTRRGLVVPIGKDLLGPADLLGVPANAVGKGELSLETQPPATAPVGGGEPGPGVARVAGALEATGGPTPRLRTPPQPEDCLVIGAPGQGSRNVSVARLTRAAAGWEFEAKLLGEGGLQSWHGAAVVAVKDGALIGLVWAPDRAKKPVIVPLDEKAAGSAP